jgi:hypothetical protein
MKLNLELTNGGLDLQTWVSLNKKNSFRHTVLQNA